MARGVGRLLQEQGEAHGLASEEGREASSDLGNLRANVILISLDDGPDPFELGERVAKAVPGARIIAMADPAPRRPEEVRGLHLRRPAALHGPSIQPLQRRSEERGQVLGGPWEHAEVRNDPRGGYEDRLKKLTPREAEVLGLLTEGLTGQEIARRLTLSPNTVRSHVQNLTAKLEVRSRLEAVALAVRNGFTFRPELSPREPRVLGST